MKVDRRAFLAGIAAAASGCVPRYSGEFPIGVASHVVGPTNAVLWTRAITATNLDVAYWRDGQDEATAEHFAATVKDGVVHAQVEGLEPNARYNFVFTAEDGTRSDVGTLRTQPPADALIPVTIGATSCIKDTHSDDALAHAATRSDLDAFIYLGDTIYADAAITLADYRREWLNGLAGPGYRALRGSTSLISLWDDHEVYNDWEATRVNKNRLSYGQQTFIDHQPGTPVGPMWRKLSWGATVDLFVLDTRSERDVANGIYISQEQAAWLIEEVRASKAMFKLILNSVPISSFDSPLFALFAKDNWLSCPAQREEVLRGIEETGATGVHFLSGDFHFATVGRISPDGKPGSKLMEFLVGPGAQNPNPSPTYPSKPQWDFASGINNYATFAMDPDKRSMTVKYHRGDGRVMFEAEYPA